MNIQKGDVFCVASPGEVIPSLILAVTRFWSYDMAAVYHHSGILLDSHGMTLEAKRRVEFGRLDWYAGRPIIIARPLAPEGLIDSALNDLTARRLGQIYPAWRIALHLVPPLARRINGADRVVCSELTAEFEQMIGVRGAPYHGTCADTLADEWCKWRDFDVLFEGTLGDQWPN